MIVRHRRPTRALSHPVLSLVPARADLSTGCDSARVGHSPGWALSYTQSQSALVLQRRIAASLLGGSAPLTVRDVGGVIALLRVDEPIDDDFGFSLGQR